MNPGSFSPAYWLAFPTSQSVLEIQKCLFLFSKTPPTSPTTPLEPGNCFGPSQYLGIFSLNLMFDSSEHLVQDLGDLLTAGGNHLC